MNELLKKLLESEVLSADTKTQLEEAVNLQIQTLVEQTKQETEERVRVELAEQWIQSRDVLIEAVETLVQDRLNTEIEEIREHASQFRDLEVEYATKLTEAKAQMAVTVRDDMAELMEMMNEFLTDRLEAEIGQLREDIEDAKKNQFGKTMFESFVQMYTEHFVDESEVQQKLHEAQNQLAAVTAKLTEAAQTRTKMERTMKLESVLAPLTGVPRELMETILSTVPTAELDKTYNKFIGRVLKESSAPAQPITEGVTDQKQQTTANPVVVSGDKTPTEQVVESAQNAGSVKLVAELQRLAGIRQ